MLIDNKILQRHGIYEVLAESQNIVFRDDSSQRLNFLRRNGVDDLYLRAFERAPGRWCVFDLRTLDRSFAVDLPHALHRDRPGMVMFSLRALFRDASTFSACCLRNLEAVWFSPEPNLRPAIGGVQTPAITFQPELPEGHGMNIIVMADGHEVNVEHGLGIVTIEAIAHSLAQINRFNGHALRPYSVAEHSLLVVEILEREFIAPWPDALYAALMHDAHEAMSSDLHSPGKAVIGAAWHHWEERFESMVRSTFGLHTAATAHRDLVHKADLIALATERRDLLPNARELSAWPVLEGVQPVNWVNLRDPGRARSTWEDWRVRFLDKVHELEFARQLLAIPDQAEVHLQ